MKILLARSGYSASGGAERYLQRLGLALDAAGIEPVLLTSSSWPESAWPSGPLIRVRGDSPAAFARAVGAEREHHREALLFSMERIPVADVYRAGDGVHASWLRRLGTESGRAANWLRARRTMHLETLALERSLFTREPPPVVIANSTMVADEIHTHFGLARGHIELIPNGYGPVTVDSASTARARAAVRRRFQVPDDAPLVLFLGSGFKRKGADILAAAFASLEHPTAHLVIAGKGKLKDAVPGNVHAPGAVEDPGELLRSADLFALPTLYDPFANACIEAAAHSLPVLTSCANGFADALRDHPQAGEIVNGPRNVRVWRDALARWLAPGVASDARSAALALAGNYTLTSNMARTVELLQRVDTAVRP